MYRRQQSGFDRVPFVQRCEVEQGGHRQSALLCNLSLLGAYVHTQHPPPRNSEIALTFPLPDGAAPVVVGATVTWVNDGPSGATALPRGFGAHFFSAEPDDLRRIATMVASFLSSPEPEFQFGVGMPPSGKARIPFVAPCVFAVDSQEIAGSVCNLSTLGVYVAFESIPALAAAGRVRFGVPELAGDFEVDAVVAWINTERPRKIPALPAGCGFRFEHLSPIDEMILTTVVDNYLGAVAAERGLEKKHEA